MLVTHWATHDCEELARQPDAHAEAFPQEASGSGSAVPAGRRLPRHAAVSQTFAAPVDPVSRALHDLPQCLCSPGLQASATMPAVASAQAPFIEILPLRAATDGPRGHEPHTAGLPTAP